MAVLITGSTFLSGAAVKITGSYPPYSIITIAHNTFASQENCGFLGVIGYFVTVIAFIDTVPIVLGEGAAISVQRNTITAAGITMDSIPLMCTSITFSKGSSASIRENTIRVLGNGVGVGTLAILFDTVSPFRVIGNTEGATFRFLGGAWLFEENSIRITI